MPFRKSGTVVPKNKDQTHERGGQRKSIKSNARSEIRLKLRTLASTYDKSIDSENQTMVDHQTL